MLTLENRLDVKDDRSSGTRSILYVTNAAETVGFCGGEYHRLRPAFKSLCANSLAGDRSAPSTTTALHLYKVHHVWLIVVIPGPRVSF